MAVFSCLSNELRYGDIFINGAETYSDYRKELLDWKSCQPLLNEYCSEVSVILQNIIDMSNIIHQLTQEGVEIREDDITFLSSYLTGHIKRFGDYLIDMRRNTS